LGADGALQTGAEGGGQVIRLVPVATQEAIDRIPGEVIEAIKQQQGAFYREHIGRLAAHAGYRWAYRLEAR
jgi:hypothetical protein